MKIWNFLYSTNENKTNQKTISVSAKNSDIAYCLFIVGLIKPATLVICKETKERII